MSSSSNTKPTNMHKGPRRLKLRLPDEDVNKESCRSDSRRVLYPSAPSEASRREARSMEYSAPLGVDVEEDWMHKCGVAGGGDGDVVVNRLSLSVSDISYMRLKGCRAAVPTPSCNSLSYPHAHFGSDVSFSTNPILFSSLHPLPGLFSEIHGVPRARSMQEMNNSNIPFLSKEDVGKSISEAQIAYRVEENKPPSDIRIDTDMENGEVTSNHPPMNESTISSTSQLKSSGSFNEDMTPLERKCTHTPIFSPRPSSSSSSKNFTPGVQPFSTWKFPILGNVDSVATTLAREGEEDEEDDGDQEDEEERVTETKSSANKPPKKINSVTNDGDHDDNNSNNNNNNNNTNNTNNNNNNNNNSNNDNSNNGNKNDANTGVAKRGSIDSDDKDQSSLGSLHDQNHKKSLRLVYDIYASLFLRVKEENNNNNNNNNNNKFIEAANNARRRSSPSWVHSTLSSTNIGLPSGYYSLGSQWGLRHPNKQIVSHVSPLLHGFTNRHHDELQRSFTTAMDPSIVALIERRPLLQTTLFAGFMYRKINQQMKLKQRHSNAQIISQPTSAKFEDNKKFHIQGKLSTEKGVNIIDTSVEPKENSFSRSSSISAAHYVSKEATGAIITEDYTTGIPSGTGILKEESSPTASHRALTQVRSWKSKVHTIDGVSRRVDNENDDLVVYVGMILMGWLEVVDLLGAGTFGQVFLCKDLRIVNRRFLHPSEIEGEDFQYWQCSHEYIPFSDPSMVPTHPPLVAVKVVKSRALFEQQSVMEAEMLVYIGAQTDSQRRFSNGKEKCNESTFHTSGIPVSDPRCQYVAKIYAHGVCYGHHCIVMERYGANLFEYVQANGFKGLPMYHIQAIGRKILSALTLLHEECNVVHSDVKPENVLLTLDSCFSSTTLSGSNIIGNNTTGDTAKITLESSGVLLGRSVKRNLMNNLLDASTSNAMEGSLPAPSALRIHPVISMDKRRSISQSKGLTGLRDQSENLVKSSIIPSLHIKLIDFSSSCYDGGNIHTYLQSRYYRAPEVILSAGYGPPIDIWSTGCLLAELLLGLPLLPGSCDYHQLYLIEEMLGPLPISLLKKGKRTFNYYDVEDSELESQSLMGSDSKETHDKSKVNPSFHLLNESEYLFRQENAPPVEWRCYFQYRTLAELVRKCMLSTEERRIAMGLSPTPAVGETTEDVGAATEGGEQETPIKSILDEMMQQRFWLYDLLKKMLHGDPSHRITAREALSHTFFSHVPEYMKPFLASEE